MNPGGSWQKKTISDRENVLCNLERAIVMLGELVVDWGVDPIPNVKVYVTAVSIRHLFHGSLRLKQAA